VPGEEGERAEESEGEENGVDCECAHVKERVDCSRC
jgi:hypothetical protein